MIYSITILVIVQLIIYFLLKNKEIHKYNAIQKIHEGDVPRIGGLIFFIGLFYLLFLNFDEIKYVYPLILSSFLIFIFSFYEDMKQSLSPLFRLIILFLGSSIFIFLIELPEINIRYLDFINKYSLIAFLVFTFSLMLLMNGFNFIDGLNGLSSINFYTILLCLFYISNILGDTFLIDLIKFLFLSSLLVFILNFPFGKIFIGDSGSYLYAFYSGALVIYLFNRHDYLPTLLALVILAYPITEMLFSIIRKVIKGKSPLQPDTMHLHHLVFQKFNNKSKKNNNFSSILMMPFSISPFFLCYLSMNYPYIGEEYLFLSYLFVYSLSYILLKRK